MQVGGKIEHIAYRGTTPRMLLNIYYRQKSIAYGKVRNKLPEYFEMANTSKHHEAELLDFRSRDFK